MDSSTNRKLGVFALLLALIGGFVMLKNASGDAEASTPRVVTPALVSTRHIVAGTLVTDILDNPSDWVEEIRLPADAVFSDTLTTLDELALRGDQVVVVDINAGAQFRKVALLTPGEQVSSAIPAPDDTLEVTIVMSPEQAVGARLVAGHRVAVVASVEGDSDRHDSTRMIAQNVLITNMELQNPNDLGSSSQGSALDISTSVQSEAHITLSGSVETVEKIVLSQAKARIVLLRQHDDASVQASSAITMYDVLGLQTPEPRGEQEIDVTTLTDEDLASADPTLTAPPEDEPDPADGEIVIVIDLDANTAADETDDDDETADGEGDGPADEESDQDEPGEDETAQDEPVDAEPVDDQPNTDEPADDDPDAAPEEPEPPAPGGGGFVLPENAFGLAGFGQN